MSRSTIITRLGAPSACGHLEAPSTRAPGRRRTRRCGGSPRPRRPRRPGHGRAGCRRPRAGARRGGRPAPSPRRAPRPARAARRSRVPKAVSRAWLACRTRPPSSMIATPSSRCDITMSSSSARTARTASDSWSMATVLSTWRRLRLMVMPRTISTTTKTWATAAWLTGSSIAGDRPDVEDGEPDAGGAREQAGRCRDHGVEAHGDPHDGERQHEGGRGLRVQHEPETEDDGGGRRRPRAPVRRRPGSGG